METALTRGPDGIVRFANLRIFAPKLALAANGFRRRDGTFHIEASGRQKRYGPVRLVLDGVLHDAGAVGAEDARLGRGGETAAQPDVQVVEARRPEPDQDLARTGDRVGRVEPA